jgi:hypothetical protein
VSLLDGDRAELAQAVAGELLVAGTPERRGTQGSADVGGGKARERVDDAEGAVRLALG